MLPETCPALPLRPRQYSRCALQSAVQCWSGLISLYDMSVAQIIIILIEPGSDSQISYFVVARCRRSSLASKQHARPLAHARSCTACRYWLWHTAVVVIFPVDVCSTRCECLSVFPLSVFLFQSVYLKLCYLVSLWLDDWYNSCSLDCSLSKRPIVLKNLSVWTPYLSDFFAFRFHSGLTA